MSEGQDVFTQAELLRTWVAQRSARRPYHRLRAPHQQAFEYQGPREHMGSNYAAVHFRCDPADVLTLRAELTWPSQVAAGDRAALMRGIAAGIVDGLLSHYYLYRGCQLTLIAIGWDDVASSEFTFYRAARATMDELRTAAAWELVSIST